jgi:predicted  nucleic acid-binding Zn-ribbon protein
VFRDPGGLRVQRVRCVECGLIYEGAEVAAQRASGCRRCGGDLERVAVVRRGPHAVRPPVVAVRSAVTGRERLPFG